MVCVGENQEQKEAEQTNEVLKQQLDAIKDQVTDWNKIVLVYEPVWAIESQVNVSTEVVEEACSYIRSWLAESVSPEVSQSLRIQYGGLVSASKAAELIACENIDGFLLGNESLSEEFLDIVSAANQVPEEGA